MASHPQASHDHSAPARGPSGSSPIRWTQERKDMLQRLWRAKKTSGEIASTLGGVSRNAVMGMVNRLGIMGQGGQAGNHSAYRDASNLLKQILGVGYEPGRTGHDETLLAIAAAVHGPERGQLASATRLPASRIDGLMRSFADAGIWHGTGEVPAHWLTGDGDVSLAMDCMVAAGVATRVMTPSGEWEYRAAPTH